MAVRDQKGIVTRVVRDLAGRLGSILYAKRRLLSSKIDNIGKAFGSWLGTEVGTGAMLELADGLRYTEANRFREVVLAKIDVEKLNPNPAFDLFLYLRVSGVAKVEQHVCDMCQEQWETFKEYLKGYRFSGSKGKQGVVLFFLEPAVEGMVEEAWARSPSEGFALHNLAVSMVMGATAEMIPEVEAGACAPLPTPDRDLKRRLERLGLVWNDAGSVSVQYAVMTHDPYRGGCAVCHLRASCPKSEVTAKV